MKKIVYSTLLTLLLVVSMMPLSVSAQQMGPEIDRLRFKVITGPASQLKAMQKPCRVDALTDLIRTNDIEKLYGEGFTITSAPGFHMGHIGINIRPNQTYKDPAHGHPDAGPVLSDANFRHALFHCYNQEEIVASIYKYIVTPVRSLVPPAYGGWCNPAVPSHPYNPGDPNAVTIYNPATQANSDSCSILRYGGYLYCAINSSWAVPYDLDGDSTPGTDGSPGTPATAILDPDDELKYFTIDRLIDHKKIKMPGLRMFTPTAAVAPTSQWHGARFVADCNRIGIPLFQAPRAFSTYLDLVFGTGSTPGGEFDLYMVFWDLGRIPDHLYDMCHSDYDSLIVPGAYNAPGIHSDELDAEVETVKFSLDHEAKMEASFKAQEMLYDPDTYPQCACAYMQLYSRIYFNTFNPGMRGVVNSPGYGSDNSWTFLNMRWASGHANERIEGSDSTVIWCLNDNPERLNPCYAHTVYAWEILGTVLDGLMAVNPYTLADLSWIAESWTIEGPMNATVTLDSNWYKGYNDTLGERILYKSAGQTEDMINGMNITYNLRSDVEWQCGNTYTPSDAEFNLEFLRNNQIPRYMSMWEHLIDVQVIDSTFFSVYVNRTSQFLIYDFAGLAAYLPPPVWTPLDGEPLRDILAYDPTANTTKPTGAGDNFGTYPGPQNQLYGTGPFIFEYLHPLAKRAELHANRQYFLSTQEIRDMKTYMFHRIGDVNYDGQIWGVDKTRYSLAYGCDCYDYCYDADADLNEDCFVDALDGILISWYWGDKKEYP